MIEIDFAASAILEGAEKAVLALRGINVGSFLAAAFIESQIGRMESVIGELYDAAEAEARQDISGWDSISGWSYGMPETSSDIPEVVDG
ncbi:MAG: hypothetical protein M1399_02120 [Actinobacteria bacterium]|nr:hypothetical protein [Actinomycetota bacterium]MCL5445977.1 hypothetical protein [Actinomycetota bacterium]